MAHAAVAPSAVVLAAITALALACQVENTDFTREVRTVQAATQPTGASLKATGEPTRGPWSVTAQWEVTAQMRWGGYVADVGNRLLGYVRVVDRPDGVEFSRDVSNDSYSLALKRVATGPPLRVSVNLSVLPK
jgi:hypothetical protein